MTPGDDDPLTPDEGTIDAGSQLTAEELAALAESLQGSAPRPARPTQDVRQEAEQKAVVLRYDLVGSRTTHHYDMPALDLVQEQFALVLAGILSRTTRQEATFRAKDPVILNFSEVYASLRMPSGISVVEVQGVGGNGLVLFDAELLLHLVDLLMGGNGGPSDVMARVTERGFTATEKHLIRTMVEMVDKALCQAWADITPVGLRVTRIAADPRHAAIFLPGDRVASFEVETTWGAITGSIRFVLPVEALRPFEKRLAQTATTPSLTPDKDWHGASPENSTT